MDPFALTADPRTYCARPACEAALAALEQGVRSGALSALSGPPGIGKTLLLRLLERRLASDFRPVYVPYGALSFPELCGLALGLLGAGGAPGDPVAALAEAAHRDGRPLLLLLDDANAIPLATLRALVALARLQGGALRLVAVPVDDARAAQVLAALGRGVAHVRFSAPMSADETTHYVAARLAHERARDPALARLTPACIAWLHRESGGVPRRLHQLVAWILHREGKPPDCAGEFGDVTLELDAG